MPFTESQPQNPAEEPAQSPQNNATPEQVDSDPAAQQLSTAQPQESRFQRVLAGFRDAIELFGTAGRLDEYLNQPQPETQAPVQSDAVSVSGDDANPEEAAGSANSRVSISWGTRQVLATISRMMKFFIISVLISFNGAPTARVLLKLIAFGVAISMSSIYIPTRDVMDQHFNAAYGRLTRWVSSQIEASIMSEEENEGKFFYGPSIDLADNTNPA